LNEGEIMKIIKVLINGCNGKMGQEVAKKVRMMDGVEVFGGVDIKDCGDNFFPVYIDLEDSSKR